MKKQLKLGITSLIYHSHLNTTLSLGKELKKRGHQIIYYGFIDAKDRVLAAGLEFYEIGENERPLGTYTKVDEKVNQLVGYPAFKFFVNIVEKQIGIYLCHLPNVLASSNIDALLYDQALFGFFSIPESLNIPCIEFCSALALIPTEVWFRPVTSAPFPDYSLNPLKLIPNIIVERINSKFLLGSLRKSINQFRKTHKLPPISTELGLFQGKKLATIAQLIPELDFPTHFLPRNFYYCGSFSQNTSETDIAFPYEKLSEQPLIYASLGTMQNGIWELFKIIDDACSSLDAQLVLSFGKKGALSNYPINKLSPNTISVDYAPQKNLIRKSTLIITHSGMNSVLEALWEGKPMVCIPIAHEQPDIAARMKRVGVAEFIPLEKLTQEQLRDAILKVLKERKYKQNAFFFQRNSVKQEVFHELQILLKQL